VRTPTDEELLTAAGPGAAAAFAAFYERWEPAILAWFVRRTGSAELAADLAAETFAEALAGRLRFRPGRGDAAGWLFGIAGHLLARSARRGAVEERGRLRLDVTPVVLDDDTVAAVEALAGDDAVARLLDALPEDQRDAVRARILDDATYEDIARRLGCSTQVVRKRVSRGLATLRTRLEDAT
jgi:RNA polymerase sigma factor (sigma-70 family)